MYIDRATIHVEAGHGGAGSASFRREKYVPKGGPDGGDGGHGGSVIIQAVPEELTLIALHYQTVWKAKAGGSGRGQKLHGANGADVIVKVPVGTLIFVAESSELLADLDEASSSSPPRVDAAASATRISSLPRTAPPRSASLAKKARCAIWIWN